MGFRCWSGAAVVCAFLGLGSVPLGAAPAKEQNRNYDARIESNAKLRQPASAAQREAIQALRSEIPELAVSFDESTGATRSLYNRVGYLTSAASATDAKQVGLDFVGRNLSLLGLGPEDLAEHEVTDSVYTKATGTSSVYLRQTHKGLPLYNGQLHYNVNREGRLLSVNNLFLPGLSRAVNATAPSLSAAEAVVRAAQQIGLDIAVPGVLRGPEGVRQTTVLSRTGVSLEAIEAKLMLLPIRAGEARLVWNFQIATADSQHHYDFTVDAVDGTVWTRFDWVASDQYKVYEQPVESPNHSTAPPPADGRTTQVNPANATASPYGWHDTNGTAGPEYTVTRGNNVHAYEDRDANNAPPAADVDCGGSLDCSFPIDFTLAPDQYIPAAVTNLYYWNNIIHDVQYQYGFDEVGGNFQVNTYGRGGVGNDDVRAEAQDGSGTNNANFSTPADGSRPRMQMYIWTAPTPDKDGDLDAGIVVHEYGHGISNRLVGGPGNVSCLGNTQQPGEGLSDWWSLAYTARPEHTGPLGRGVGTYALNQPVTGPGIRTQRYSTDSAVNTWTYASINGMAVPHGVGSVWAQAAWEVYWALVDAHGFSTNLYNAAGGAGNQRAMLYVNQGLKNTICSPAFTDVRDGIIQAAVDNHSGQDVCRIWKAFAAFGLGQNAISGGSSSTTPTNGFEIPTACRPAAPTNMTATPNGNNRVDVAWDASAGAVSYNVYRTIGACPQVSYSLLASGLTATNYSDYAVSGGTTYAYVVTSVNADVIESQQSACDDALAAGACTLAPSFAGLSSVANPATGSCTLNLGWSAATQACGSGVVYNVYRSTTSGFTPGASNRIASCVSATNYSDTGVAGGPTYYYVVRAEDNSGNGTGPCANGNEDPNTSQKAGDPQAVSAFFDDMEGATSLWTTNGTTGNPWVVVTTASQSPTHSWFVDDPTTVKDQRVAWAAAVTVPATSPVLSFWNRYNTENGWDGGVLEYSTDSGTNWFDILAGNGGTIPANPARFLQNGYNRSLNASGNPLGGRQAWSGNNTAFQDVRVNMADFGGTGVNLRWRFGSDSSVGAPGWWFDDVNLGYSQACTPSDLIFRDGFQ